MAGHSSIAELEESLCRTTEAIPREYEGAVVARLSQQSVPIVLVDPDELAYFRRLYPSIGKYLDDRFHKVGEFTPDAHKIHIYVETNRPPVGTDAEFGWPYFATPSSTTTAGEL